jgi:hypothetical protein
MQTLTERVFELAPPGGLFDQTVIGNLFPNASTGARRLLLHRAVDQGEVLRLTRGVYCLAEAYRKSQPHPFAVAALLCFPSHVSLESALAYHALIPEAVYGVTSATLQRSREYHTPLGHFAYVRVPADDPTAGVKAVRLDRQWWTFVASPLRAIADLISARRGIAWRTDGVVFLTDSMRIDREDLRSLPLDDFEEICTTFRNPRVRAYLTGLREELTR